MIQVAHAIANLDRSFAEADEAYCRMLQLTPVELCKRDILSVTYHADRVRNETSVHRLVDHGVPFWIRKRYVRDDGSVFWVLNHVSRLVGFNGAHRIAASSFVLPTDVHGDQADGLDPNDLAARTVMLKKLLQHDRPHAS